MKDRSVRTRILAVLGMVAVVLAIYVLWARPVQLRWGATDAEVGRSMPGDELNPHPAFLATRAITIQGRPEQIWPWLMQMGYGRAGLYGFDLFHSVSAPRGTYSAERILPEFQDFQVGDPLPLTPIATMRFHSIQPNQSMVWTAGDGNAVISWGLYLVDAGHTRLVIRTRWSHHWMQPGQLSLDLLSEFTDPLAVREMLQGIQGRVEARIQPRSDVTIKLFIYVGALLVYGWAAISVLRLPLTWGSWLIGLSGGLTWLVSWYAPTSIWLGAVLAMLVVWAIRVEERDVKRAKIIQQAKPQAPPGRKRSA